MILKYLIPVKLAMGVLPRDWLLEKYNQLEDWDRQSPTQVVTEICGFVTILSGTFLLHKTKDMADGAHASLPIRLPNPKHSDDAGVAIPLRRQSSSRT